MLVVPALVHAGNTDGVLLGNDAAITGGAVTATVRSGSSLWYNPAGLMNIMEQTLDLSATAYAIRMYRIPKALETTDGQAADADINEVLIIPAALSYVRPIAGGARLGIGIFTPALGDFSQRTSLEFVDDNGLYQKYKVASQNEVAFYHGVLGVAFGAGSKVRLGFTGHLLYVSVTESSQVGVGFKEDPTLPTSIANGAASFLTSLSGVGFRFGAGLQWDIDRHVTLGATFQTASWLVFASSSSSSVDAFNSTDPEIGLNFTSEESDIREALFDEIEPYRLRLGLAYRFNGGWVDFDADIQWWSEGVFVNGRVGTLFDVSKMFRVGVGAFTDRRVSRADPEIYGDSAIDFYGASAGIEISNSKKFDPSEGVEGITFGTTVGVRYALGVGDVVGLLLPTATAASTLQKVNITVHELSVHVGGDLRF